ncbi:BTAD domain-containing putative transcriptional regulator [Agromyces sp. Marseille-Q5079]|uniref:BTAD domain-containing putative transcriptional regulator n=1 Tax=Agromyces sp. Marseille-Q5079 TaxID=3439059 RepID=UPI003D9C9980
MGWTMEHAQAVRGDAVRNGVDRPHLRARLTARRVFLIAGTGSGKSALIERMAGTDPGAFMLRLEAAHTTPSTLASALEEARDSGATTVLVDHAEWCVGCEASDVLERFVADAPMRVVIASREPLPYAVARAEYGETSVLGVRDLAIRLDEVADVFRSVGARMPSLAQASRLLEETAGSPMLVAGIAAAVAASDRDDLDTSLHAATEGDVLASALESMLIEVAPSTRAALGRACALPRVHRSDAVDLLGPERGGAVVRLLEDGAIPHRLGPDGARHLPRMLRRHLLAELATDERNAAIAAAARLVPPHESVRLLADLGDVDGVSERLRSMPSLLMVPGVASWAVPRAIPGDELADLLRIRALLDDREPEPSGRRLDAIEPRVGREHAPVVTALRTTLDELWRPVSTRSTVHGSTVHGSTVRGSTVRGSTVATGRLTPLDVRVAAYRLLVGDAVGAIGLLAPRLHADRDSASERIGARLVLIVARSGITPRVDTATALCSLEFEASARGLAGLARLARGLLAALAPESSPRTVQEVIDECETRSDLEGAAFIDAAWLLTRIRAGRGESRRATRLAERLRALGAADAAAVASAAGAYLAAVHHEPRAAAALSEAEASALVSPSPAARSWLDAAHLLHDGDEDHRRSGRTAARDAGMPRLPVDLPSRPSNTTATPDRSEAARTSAGLFVGAPVLVDRIPRVTVGCFGGFRLGVGGRDLDLHGVRPQARSVLRMLALHAGSPVHRELIAEVIWRDLGPTSAMHALHVSVSSLRRALGLDTADRIVVRDGEAYQLHLADRRDCDLADFDANLEGASAARRRGDAAGTADGLRLALQRYTGDVLPEDGPAEWAVGARDRYRMRATAAASALAHLELRAGDRGGALDAATRAIEIDPWHDAAWRALLAVHRQSGDVAATQRTEQGYRRMRAALGVD